MSPRYLDYVASYFKLTAQQLRGQDNLATVTALEGEFHGQFLFTALYSLFKRHANLRVKKIAWDDKTKRFYTERELHFQDISQEFIEVQDDEHWRKVLWKQLALPVPENGPHWRIIHITIKNTDPKRHYLIQVFDPCLFDEISTANLAHELLTHYGTLVYGNQWIRAKDEFSEGVNPWPCAENQRSFEAYKNDQEQLLDLYPSLPGSPFQSDASLSERRTQAILLAFKLDPIPAICRARQLTMSGLLTAVGLLALRDGQSVQQKDSGFDSSVLATVDLRDPKLGVFAKITSNHSSRLLTRIAVPQKIAMNTSAWDVVARDYERNLGLFTERLAKPPIDFSIDEICNHNGIHNALRRHHFDCGIGISDISKISLRKNYGNIEVLFYHSFTNQIAGFSEVLLNVCCVDDTIFCNITYVEPLHNHQWAVEFAVRFIHYLNDALQNTLTLVEEGTDKEIVSATTITDGTQSHLHHASINGVHAKPQNKKVYLDYTAKENALALP